MHNPFISSAKYHAAEYKCINCLHQTIIFIDAKYSMFGLIISDKPCAVCKAVKTLSDGDLVIRYDWPDADDNPWQLQCGFMREEDRYCKACRSKATKDWRKIIVACSKCDGYMEYNK
jgi:hypothetical protein